MMYFASAYYGKLGKAIRLANAYAFTDYYDDQKYGKKRHEEMSLWLGFVAEIAEKIEIYFPNFYRYGLHIPVVYFKNNQGRVLFVKDPYRFRNKDIFVYTLNEMEEYFDKKRVPLKEWFKKIEPAVKLRAKIFDERYVDATKKQLKKCHLLMHFLFMVTLT